MKTIPLYTVLIIFKFFIIGSGLFLYGFFPVSHTNDERASFDDLPNLIDDIKLNRTNYQKRVSYTILMIVDAMKYDFISQQNMRYVMDQVSRKNACLLKIKVDTPTVTMPRIKSLTTGTISNFIDVVLNLGSSEIVSDSIIHQMYDRGDKIVFYGDNTWTKLFPGLFYRKQENFDSFFVNDFYEGDKNITKRLAAELKHPIWNFMILHFLGLDHIGHVESSFSPKIPDKLSEMDRVAQQIHTSTENAKSNKKMPPFFILTSDHGMRDSGGHGGNSAGEVNIPLIAFGIPCLNNIEATYNQIDIAPTTAILLGLPIPASSIGCVITELLISMENEDQLYVLFYNTKRLIEKLIFQFGEKNIKNRDYFLQYKSAIDYHKFYLTSKQYEMIDTNAFKQAKIRYESSSKIASEILASSLVKFDLLAIIFALVIVIISCINMFMAIPFINKEYLKTKINGKNFIITSIAVLFIGKFLCQIFNFNSDLCGSSPLSFVVFELVSLLIFANWTIFQRTTINKRILNIGKLHPIIIFGTIFQALSMFSSSFIEEEHQTWYYLTNTVLIIGFINELKALNLGTIGTQEITLKDLAKAMTKEQSQSNDDNAIIVAVKKIKCVISITQEWTFLFCIHIFIRRLNQTGDKWINIPDIADWLVREENKLWLSIFLFIALLLLVYANRNYNGVLTGVLSFTAIILIYYYRTVSGSVSLFDIKQSKSVVSLLIFWVNVFELLAINYVPAIYKLIFVGECNAHIIKNSISTNITTLTLILALLHKPHNVILLPICIKTLQMVFKSCDCIYRDENSLIFKTIASYWIGKMFFFYQGNSNNIASIDLNAGYIGLDSYNPVIVLVFVSLCTYSGPIISFMVLLHHIFNENDTEKNKQNISTLIILTSFLVLFPTTIYLFVMTICRSHLFIWTVFSPKVLYECFNVYLFYFILGSTCFIYCILNVL